MEPQNSNDQFLLLIIPLKSTQVSPLSRKRNLQWGQNLALHSVISCVGRQMVRCTSLCQISPLLLFFSLMLWGIRLNCGVRRQGSLSRFGQWRLGGRRGGNLQRLLLVGRWGGRVLARSCILATTDRFCSLSLLFTVSMLLQKCQNRATPLA